MSFPWVILLAISGWVIGASHPWELSHLCFFLGGASFGYAAVEWIKPRKKISSATAGVSKPATPDAVASGITSAKDKRSES
jgi:hypothetical protein